MINNLTLQCYKEVLFKQKIFTSILEKKWVMSMISRQNNKYNSAEKDTNIKFYINER